MSAIASNEAPIIAQAQVDNAALAGTAMEKSLGRGSVDVTSMQDTITSSDDEVSEADLQNLRRVSGKIPWAAFTVAFVELCERFSYYGTTVVCMWRSPILSNQDLLTKTSCQLHPTASPRGVHHRCWACRPIRCAGHGPTGFNRPCNLQPVLGLCDAFTGRIQFVSPCQVVSLDSDQTLQWLTHTGDVTKPYMSLSVAP